jgi:hypothetical protein
MRLHGTFALLPALAVLWIGSASVSGTVIDRIAVVVGNTVITEREVLREVRLTEFINGQPLDLGPSQRRAAANRLVDQQLIRNEMEEGGYGMPSEVEAAKMLRNFERQHYPEAAQFHAALDKYGLTKGDLQQHLLWELAVVRFTDQRFQPNIPVPPEQSANRMSRGASPPPANSVDEQLDAWLKEQRANTRIQFKPGAFQ